MTFFVHAAASSKHHHHHHQSDDRSEFRCLQKTSETDQRIVVYAFAMHNWLVMRKRSRFCCQLFPVINDKKLQNLSSANSLQRRSLSADLQLHYGLCLALATVDNVFAATAHAPYHVTHRPYGQIFLTYVECLTSLCLITVQLLRSYDAD